MAFCSLTLDIISDVCFGKDFGLLGDEEKGEEWAGILKIVFSGALLLMHFPWLLKIMNLIPGRWAGPVIRHHRVSCVFVMFYYMATRCHLFTRSLKVGNANGR